MDRRTRSARGAGALSAVTCGAGVGWLQYRAATTDPWPDSSTYSGVGLLVAGLLLFAAPMAWLTYSAVRRAPVTLGWAGVVNVAVAAWLATRRLGNMIGLGFPIALVVGGSALWAGLAVARWYGRRLRAPHL